MVKVKENLTGKIFGRWTVIEQVEDHITPSGKHIAKWLCECSCEKHTHKEIKGIILKNGYSKSCGCIQKEKPDFHIKDLTGKKFGRLTVIELCGRDNSGEAIWLCECDCEAHNKIKVRGRSLRYGYTQSCGCWHKEKATEVNKKENKRDLTGNYGILWSTNTNEEIYFDLEDANKILQHTWYIDSHGYPYTRIDGKNIKMHIFLGFKWHDHINKNKKDNRKENYRPCTNQENTRNGSLRKTNYSGFIGVNWSDRYQKWVARIMVDGKNISCGVYINKDDAIKARLQAERDYFGEFAPQQHLFEQYGI